MTRTITRPKALKLDLDQSLTVNLTANGFGHRRANDYGKHTIYSLESGETVACLNCFEAWAWLEAGAPVGEGC